MNIITALVIHAKGNPIGRDDLKYATKQQTDFAICLWEEALQLIDRQYDEIMWVDR